MNPAQEVAFVCQHQEIVIALLTVIPLASIASWWSAKMPPWLRVTVQVLATNWMHVLAGTPLVLPAAQSPDMPASQSPPAQPNPGAQP